MNLQKTGLGGLAGGVVYFLLGWLFYGILLMDFFADNAGSATGVMKADADMIWWALILGNIFSGLLLAYIIDKANAKSATGGAKVGFIVGLLFSLGFDLVMYATSNLTTLKSLAADVAVSTVMSAIAGAVIGWVLGSGKKALVS